MMNVVFRADASPEIGWGHVTRCLTLAVGLKERGHSVLFLCREIPPSFRRSIENQRVQVALIKEKYLKGQPSLVEQGDENWEGDFEKSKKIMEKQGCLWDWVIIDHYGLDIKWERSIRPLVKRVMVIDDLGDREHDCDVILDQALGETGTRYRHLIPKSCKTCFGSRYSLLRSQFRTIRERIESEGRPDFNKIRIHIFFGSYDPWGYTIRFSRLLLSHFSTVEILAAVGSHFARLNELKTLEQEFEGRFHWDAGVKEMASHMGSCNMAFGAPGMATWERACLGLPSGYLATAVNQISILKNLESQGLSVYLGEAMAISDDVFLERFGKIIWNKNKLLSMRETAMKAVDGKGVSRVISVLTET